MAANPTPILNPTPDLILQAAERVVMRDGVLNLTLENVAREAKLSKGGLLYHYPSKDALITGMVKRYLDGIEAKLEVNVQKEVPGKGAWIRAFLKTMIDGASIAHDSGSNRAWYAAMVSAMLLNPSLLEPMRQKNLEWKAKFEEDANDLKMATVARFAARGLWFTEVVGFSALTDQERQDLADEILKLVGEPAK